MYQSGQSQSVDGALPSKTPVSLLQELCMRRGISPKYDLLQIEGPVHEPTFVYRVTVGEFAANGSGQTKKKAKHATAKAVLDIIIQGGSGSQGQSGTTPEITSQIVSPYDDGIPGNPVGALQELCMSRRWPPPTYDLTAEEGFPHERTFSICCAIGNHKEIGAGKSKKLSKRQAAHRMHQKLKDQPVENLPMGMLADDDDEVKDSGSTVPECSRPSLTKACSKDAFSSHVVSSLKHACSHLSPVFDPSTYCVCKRCFMYLHENEKKIDYYSTNGALDQPFSKDLCGTLVPKGIVKTDENQNEIDPSSSANLSKNALGNSLQSEDLCFYSEFEIMKLKQAFSSMLPKQNEDLEDVSTTKFPPSPPDIKDQGFYNNTNGHSNEDYSNRFYYGTLSSSETAQHVSELKLIDSSKLQMRRDGPPFDTPEHEEDSGSPVPPPPISPLPKDNPAGNRFPVGLLKALALERKVQRETEEHQLLVTDETNSMELQRGYQEVSTHCEDE